MNFKAIIFDLDGTAIPNTNGGMPSQRLIKDVQKAKKLIKVTVATGRPISNCRHILKSLNIDQPCIIAGGTQIINPKTEETIWEKRLSKEHVEKIIGICLSYSYQIYFSDEEESSTAREKQDIRAEQIVYIMTVSKEDTQTILRQLDTVKGVVAHEVNSWTPNHSDIHITHKEATKKHALEELLKIIEIDKNELLAVGDSNNDLPLFEVAGYKVAMGNATDRMREVANYITSTVDQEGLAKVIEEKILKFNY